MLEAPFQLPPLILHPFTDASTSIEVLQDAKEAAEILVSGESPSASEQLQDRLLAGRYAELRMLLFVGKDVCRWLNQCVDFSQRNPRLRERGYVEQSFAEYLIGHTPPDVEAKLRRWGVTDYARIFGRSIGIYLQFRTPPARQILGPEYLRQYYRYADYAYACWKDQVKFPVLSPSEFTFLLYASGEYSKFLEEQWR